MIKQADVVKRWLACGWVLSRGCSGGFLLVNEAEVKHKQVLPRVVRELESAGKIVRCDDRTSRVGARWRLADKLDAAEQGKPCDCQNPPPSDSTEGVWHVSEECPIHGPIEGFVAFTGTPGKGR